jgi:2'-5' RNA ligase
MRQCRPPLAQGLGRTQHFTMDSENAGHQRLFIGLPLSRECAEVLASADPGLRGLRWMGAAQLHLTLSFLGEVESGRAAGLRTALAGVGVAPFFLPLQGMGAFQSHGKPSVVWVGVGRGHPHLFALHKRVQDAVLQEGLEPDLRPFHPHVTVGRGKGISRAALQPFLRKHAETEWGMLKVEEFILYSSRLLPEGSEYREELRVRLGG